VNARVLAVVTLVAITGGCRQQRPAVLAPAPVDELSPVLAQARRQTDNSEHLAALASWERVLTLTARAQPSPEREEAVRREALTAIARSPYWVGRLDEAWLAFQRLGGSQAKWMMEQKADACRAIERLGCAADAARLLIRAEPQSPRVCLWRAHTMRAATLSDGHAMLAEAKQLGEAFDWTVKGNRGTASERLACEVAFHSLTGEAAHRVHRKAQEQREIRLYQLAAELYEEYLPRLGQKPETYDQHFFYAEALWITERWSQAADEYDLVVRMDPKGKHSKEASYAALFSFRICNDLNLETPPKPTPELHISPCLQKELERLDQYLRLYQPSPEDDTYVKVLYRKARLFFDANYLDGAIPLFQRIVTEFPTSELAAYTAFLHVRGLKILGQYREAIETADNYLNGLLKSDAQKTEEVRLLRDETKLAQATANGLTGGNLAKLKKAIKNDKAAMKKRFRRKAPDPVPQPNEHPIPFDFPQTP
jgi:tetratricopeptide (TPR) repeat protein